MRNVREAPGAEGMLKLFVLTKLTRRSVEFMMENNSQERSFLLIISLGEEGFSVRLVTWNAEYRFKPRISLRKPSFKWKSNYLRPKLHRITRQNVTRLPDCIINKFDISIKNVAANMFDETPEIANWNSLNLEKRSTRHNLVGYCVDIDFLFKKKELRKLHQAF